MSGPTTFTVVSNAADVREIFEHVYPDATTGEEWHVIVLDLGAPSCAG